MTEPSRYRWAHVALAALAMVATLPGRTHGLGLFTEPICRTFGITTASYGFLGLWATWIGALFCLPCGWLLDRVGTRLVLTGVTVGLGATVLLMSRLGDTPWVVLGESLAFPVGLFALVLLTRGFGQSALSVASLSLVARSAGQREGPAMGVYALLTTIGFVAAFGVLAAVIVAEPTEWRRPWARIGVGVLASAAIFLLLVRNRVLEERTAAGGGGHTLGQALGSPVFWLFALATSFYGLVAAGTSLFGQQLLEERGLTRELFATATAVAIPFGLAGNVVVGFLAPRISLGYILAAGMAMLVGALAWFPYLHGETQAYLYSILLAAAGGVVTVAFFTVWRPAFGLAHLGRIQGAAQFFTVVFSGVGQWLFGGARDWFGSFSVLFPYLAVLSGAFAVAAVFVRVPRELK